MSVVGVVAWGTLMGSMLPLALRRFGLDPASASAPLVATLVDVTGLLIYFTFASFWLVGVLG
jgi:magnesium transporter